MNRATVKAGLAVVGSLLGYAVARQTKAEDTLPYVLLGGFFGTFVGEEFVEARDQPRPPSYLRLRTGDFNPERVKPIKS